MLFIGVDQPSEGVVSGLAGPYAWWLIAGVLTICREGLTVELAACVGYCSKQLEIHRPSSLMAVLLACPLSSAVAPPMRTECVESVLLGRRCFARLP